VVDGWRRRGEEKGFEEGNLDFLPCVEVHRGRKRWYGPLGRSMLSSNAEEGSAEDEDEDEQE